ncbi:MAG: metallophosphoesterase [Nanoarchaeota archaeon]
MGKKIRILAASDIHGDTRATKKLAVRAEKEQADVVVLCGDITGIVETPNLIKPFKDRGQKVLLLPGNWDSFATTDFLAQFYGMKNIHGYSARYGSVGFFGAGGADIGPFNSLSERELLKTLEQAHNGLEGIEKKVMVTHMHPLGSASELSGVSGSKSIRKAIQKFKPDILIHGHIHEAAGADELIEGTRVINVGKKGVIFEI